jgi:hypothetical protein
MDWESFVDAMGELLERNKDQRAVERAVGHGKRGKRIDGGVQKR